VSARQGRRCFALIAFDAHPLDAADLVEHRLRFANDLCRF